MQQDDSERSDFQGKVHSSPTYSSPTYSSPSVRHRKVHHQPPPRTSQIPNLPPLRKRPSVPAQPLSRKWWSSSPQETTIIVLLIVIIMLLLHRPTELGYTDGIRGGSNTKNQFQGASFWNPGKTLEVKTLYETSFARFQIHKVKAGKNVIDDWLWCDEMDHVNVLVQESKTGKFVIFRQTKYGNPGPPTLAVVGGMVEPGETPLEAARRELMEELQLESTDWVSMGQYRAAVNRGGGYTHTFLAKNAAVAADHNIKVKGQADLERQDIVKCTQEELLQYVLDGKFGEIKWTATVALSLLRLRSGLSLNGL
mmetsp:Transcript_45893/g.111169  ORF Transcript_45893/g.111169 Transcript_45893/m.111169 type:complete len:310 (-) Transcript_45893:2749-3678(-)